LRFVAARRSARFGPCDGGSEELSGVFGGRPSFASNAATRFVSTSVCFASASIGAACTRTSAIRSSVPSRSTASRFIES
jgi:hypothetical protein